MKEKVSLVKFGANPGYLNWIFPPSEWRTEPIVEGLSPILLVHELTTQSLKNPNDSLNRQVDRGIRASSFSTKKNSASYLWRVCVSI